MSQSPTIAQDSPIPVEVEEGKSYFWCSCGQSNRGWTFKVALAVFVVSFIALGYLGLQPATGVYTYLARFFTILYFSFFIFMPIYTSMEKTKPVPERVRYDG